MSQPETGTLGAIVGTAPSAANHESKHFDSAAAWLSRQDAELKADNTLRARAALAGVSLFRLDDGRWLASRWNLTRELSDSDAVSAWLDRVGGAA